MKILHWFIAICTGALVAVFRGFALSVLWGWFVMPLGVDSIEIPHAIGLSVIVGLFMSGVAAIIMRTREEGEKRGGLVNAYITSFTEFFMCSIALLVGYIAQSFM